MTKHDRPLIGFRPLTVATVSTTSISYNIAILEGPINNSTITFSRSFFTVGNNDSQLKIIPRTDQNKTIVYGPDITDPGEELYY